MERSLRQFLKMIVVLLMHSQSEKSLLWLSLALRGLNLTETSIFSWRALDPCASHCTSWSWSPPSSPICPQTQPPFFDLLPRPFLSVSISSKAQFLQKRGGKKKEPRGMSIKGKESIILNETVLWITSIKLIYIIHTRFLMSDDFLRWDFLTQEKLETFSKQH